MLIKSSSSWLGFANEAQECCCTLSSAAGTLVADQTDAGKADLRAVSAGKGDVRSVGRRAFLL